MHMPSFRSWVEQRHRRLDSHISQADKVVPLLQQAGPGGMTRRQLGGAIALEPEMVDSLIRALLDTGQIRVADVGGVHIYRA